MTEQREGPHSDRGSERAPALVIWLALVVLWAIAVGAGLRVLWAYKTTPGEAGAPPSLWPSQSRLHRITGRATLVMLAHPHCPCTHASLAELARLMARSGDRVTAYVLFIRPKEAAADFTQTESWRTAAAIPGVAVVQDNEGAEAALLHGRTSGQTMLYDARGSLLFSGGMTWARGHEGDNAGRDAITSLLEGGPAQRSKNPKIPVFGCPLRDSD